MTLSRKKWTSHINFIVTSSFRSGECSAGAVKEMGKIRPRGGVNKSQRTSVCSAETQSETRPKSNLADVVSAWRKALLQIDREPCFGRSSRLFYYILQWCNVSNVLEVSSTDTHNRGTAQRVQEVCNTTDEHREGLYSLRKQSWRCCCADPTASWTHCCSPSSASARLLLQNLLRSLEINIATSCLEYCLSTRCEFVCFF